MTPPVLDNIADDSVLPLTLYGPELSYFTGKLEAVIRYMELPYQRLIPGITLTKSIWIPCSSSVKSWKRAPICWGIGQVWRTLVSSVPCYATSPWILPARVLCARQRLLFSSGSPGYGMHELARWMAGYWNRSRRTGGRFSSR
jgi:hypothetical protein